MAKQTPWFDLNKERLLFAASVLLVALAAWSAFGSGKAELQLPSEPKVGEPPDLGAVLGAEKLFAKGSYWDESGARFVFVEPEKVRVFEPVELEVPTVEPPKIVMPLPDPGPLLQYSGALPRLDGSMPEADNNAKDDKDDKPAKEEKAGAGEKAGGGE